MASLRTAWSSNCREGGAVEAELRRSERLKARIMNGVNSPTRQRMKPRLPALARRAGRVALALFVLWSPVQVVALEPGMAKTSAETAELSVPDPAHAGHAAHHGAAAGPAESAEPMAPENQDLTHSGACGQHDCCGAGDCARPDCQQCDFGQPGFALPLLPAFGHPPDTRPEFVAHLFALAPASPPLHPPTSAPC